MKNTYQVRKTINYDKFTSIDGNRNINQLHVKRLKASMDEKQLVVPIIVNSRFQVIDGQHRLQACKELLIPVWYLVIDGYKLEDVHRLNTHQKNWKWDDYLEGYCELGYKDYIVYKGFAEKYEFSHNICIALLSLRAKDSGSDSIAFKEGNFKIKNLKESCKMAEMITMIKPFYEGYNRRSFVGAMIQLFRNDDYDHSVFLKRLSYQKTKMVDCTTTSQYLALIEEIYNYRGRQKVRLY